MVNANRSRMRLGSLVLLVLLLVHASVIASPRIIIVIIDGGRYAETIGSRAVNMPHIWNELRKEGTIYTNFRNDGITKTCAGHASVLSGTWQQLKNDGSERSTAPTLFEYYREQTAASESSCYVISGKAKLSMLTYSTDSSYGKRYGAKFVVPAEKNDIATWQEVVRVMDRSRPDIMMINLADVDINGHDKRWPVYLESITRADSIVDELWRKIQKDSVYRNMTTLFVTNDHGRHDDRHGGFQNHGDSCEGCRHIFMLALGPQFQRGRIIASPAYQVDIAVTAAELIGLRLPILTGKSLLRRTR